MPGGKVVGPSASPQPDPGSLGTALTQWPALLPTGLLEACEGPADPQSLTALVGLVP